MELTPHYNGTQILDLDVPNIKDLNINKSGDFSNLFLPILGSFL